MINKRSATLAQLIPRIYDEERDAIKVLLIAENTPPSNILLSTTEVNDGSVTGTRIAVISVVDSNENEQHTLEITNDPDDKFDIENNPTTDESPSYLILTSSVDYATKRTHLVSIKATDPAGLSIEKTFVISVVEAYVNVTSIVLDGVTEYLQATNPSDFYFSDGVSDKPFSVSTWIKMDAVTRCRIISKGDVTDREWLFTINDSDELTLLLNDATSANFLIVTSDITLETLVDEWVMLSCTYDGSSTKEGIELYINDVNVSVSRSSGGAYSNMKDSSLPCVVGAFIGSNFADGNIDETILFSKELSAPEISELYNAGVPYEYSSHSAFSHAIAWWRYELGKGDDATSIIGRIQDFSNNNNYLTPLNTAAGNLVEDVP